ncbi:HI0074 family nucleotidyltransferase substrate-binding subunit [Selenomonas sp. ND2010]|uniref:HI0074 family nucleotidyltransferase substrate-binding subunit n=1 Tax=Selenomonas sp. ND2010 TaxID=1410618 RepID=UPI00051C4B93|nr:HI0074 family nucleotidyltransferase substrate-binding subunit [Selenomonas sp. ND2010]
MKKYENYSSNLRVLAQASKQDLTNDFIISGVIDKFFIQFELGWKLMKELMQYEGRREGMTGSPRAIIKAAYVIYDFLDEEVWLSMLRDRNDMTHIYDGEAAKRLVDKIIAEYIPAFIDFGENIKRIYG